MAEFAHSGVRHREHRSRDACQVNSLCEENHCYTWVEL